ncbi:TPA: hypothetical protein I7730_00150 [Vibrio vulnificus]|uniref:Uncharacterized protein n=1 Tax=Vibrio vulnificus TaxID=672 RepID=A0A8H9K6X2_VIBVL|nr:hypothetical protein [Vibrio vulnificus]HAS8538209.1 hypothetical protein [Vibrio vulnificus]
MNKSEITMKVVGQQFKDALQRLELAAGEGLEFIVALKSIDDKTLLTEKDVSPENCEKRDFLIWVSLYLNLLNSASIRSDNLELIKVIVEAFKGHLNQEDMIQLNTIYNKLKKENNNTYNQMSILFTDSSLMFYSEKDTNSVLNLIS